MSCATLFVFLLCSQSLNGRGALTVEGYVANVIRSLPGSRPSAFLFRSTVVFLVTLQNCKTVICGLYWGSRVLKIRSVDFKFEFVSRTVSALYIYSGLAADGEACTIGFGRSSWTAFYFVG